MGERINAGYIITDSIHVGNTEFVLGTNQSVGAGFVTWECTGGNNYFWGHYTDNLFSAQKDLCERAMREVQIIEQNQRPHKEKVRDER